jgi:hypothetical protein
MDYINHKPMPPWPMKKRVRVALGGTVVIMGLAITLGSGVYYLFRVTGMINPVSFREEVVRRVFDDPKLVTAIHKQATTQSCTNLVLGFETLFLPPFAASTLEGNNACLQFFAKNSTGKQSYVAISFRAETRQDLIEEKLKGMQNVMSVPYPGGAGDRIELSGIKQFERQEVDNTDTNKAEALKPEMETIGYRAIILDLRTERVTFELYPDDPLLLASFYALVNSFTRLR